MNKNYCIILILVCCNFGCTDDKSDLNCFFDNNSIQFASKGRHISFDLIRGTFNFKRKQSTLMLRGSFNDIYEIEIKKVNHENVVILKFARKLSPSFEDWEEFTLGRINSQCKEDLLNSELQISIHLNKTNN